MQVGPPEKLRVCVAGWLAGWPGSTATQTRRRTHSRGSDRPIMDWMQTRTRTAHAADRQTDRRTADRVCGTKPTYQPNSFRPLARMKAPQPHPFHPTPRTGTSEYPSTIVLPLPAPPCPAGRRLPTTHTRTAHDHIARTDAHTDGHAHTSPEREREREVWTEEGRYESIRTQRGRVNKCTPHTGPKSGWRIASIYPPASPVHLPVYVEVDR